LFVSKPKDPKDQPDYYNLAEGERQGKLELVKILEDEEAAEIINAGTKAKLSLKDEDKPPPPTAAPSQPMPGMPIPRMPIPRMPMPGASQPTQAAQNPVQPAPLPIPVVAPQQQQDSSSGSAIVISGAAPQAQPQIMPLPQSGYTPRPYPAMPAMPPRQ